MPKGEVTVRFPPKCEFLFRPAPYKFLRGGRGSAKSWSVARALLVLGMNKPLRILCAREVQRSIKQSVHQLLRDQIAAMGLSHEYEVLEHEIRGPAGTLFLFSGLSDLTADSIKSFEGVDLVWLEEAQSISATSWRILTPTIRKAGSEIWATFNPQLDSDETMRRATVEQFPGTVSVEMNWRDNPWFSPKLEAERQHAQATMRAWEYEHVWEGKCLPAVEGAIYADEMAEATDRIIPMSPDPMLLAHAVWDMGWADSMAIVIVQRAASEIRVIDYVEDSRRKLSDYVVQLQAKPLVWGNDWLPHDGWATRHQSGKPDADVLKAMQRLPLRVPNADVERGIRAVRALFPRLWFNSRSPEVMRLLESLRRYRRAVPTATGEPGAPVHDAASHGADAVRYLALVADKLTNARPRVRQVEDEFEEEGGGTFAG